MRTEWSCVLYVFIVIFSVRCVNDAHTNRGPPSRRRVTNFKICRKDTKAAGRVTPTSGRQFEFILVDGTFTRTWPSSDSVVPWFIRVSRMMTNTPSRSLWAPAKINRFKIAEPLERFDASVLLGSRTMTMLMLALHMLSGGQQWGRRVPSPMASPYETRWPAYPRILSQRTTTFLDLSFYTASWRQVKIIPRPYHDLS